MKQPKFVSGPPGTGKTHLFLIDEYKELLKKYEPEKSFEDLLQTSIRFKGTHYDNAQLFYHQYKDTYKFTNYKKKEWYKYNNKTYTWELLNDDIEIRKNITFM